MYICKELFYSTYKRSYSLPHWYIYTHPKEKGIKHTDNKQDIHYFSKYSHSHSHPSFIINKKNGALLRFNTTVVYIVTTLYQITGVSTKTKFNSSIVSVVIPCKITGVSTLKLVSPYILRATASSTATAL